MGASRGRGARVLFRRRHRAGAGDAPGAAEVPGGGVRTARGDQEAVLWLQRPEVVEAMISSQTTR